MSHEIDSVELLHEYLATSVPDEARRAAAVETLLHDAEHEVLWCWGAEGYESPSAPLGTAQSQAESLGVPLSRRISTATVYLPLSGERPSGASGGESAVYLHDLFAEPLPEPGERSDAVDALLADANCAALWGWENGQEGTVEGQYDLETALQKAPSEARLWRKLSLRTKPRGHVRV